MEKSDLLKKWKRKNLNIQSVKTDEFTSRPLNADVFATEGQQRLWMLQQLDPTSIYYQYAHLVEFKGELQIEALKLSVDQLVARREILRLNFEPNDDRVKIIFREKYRFVAEEIFLSANEENYPIESVKSLATSLDIQLENLSEPEQSFLRQPFDLEKDNLFRVLFVNQEAGAFRMLISMHHIIADRGGLEILMTELIQIYHSLVDPKAEQLPALKVQFPDFAYHLSQQNKAQKIDDFWSEYLKGEAVVPQLPLDFERPQTLAFAGETYTLELDEASSQSVSELAVENAGTPNLVWFAIFHAWLYRYGAGDDVWVGSPIGLRTNEARFNLAGFMSETVVFRNQLDHTTSFAQLYEALKPVVYKSLSGDFPSFSDVLEELNPPRSANYNPLFQHMFVYNEANNKQTLPFDLEIRQQALDLKTSKFDLTLFVTKQAGGQFQLSLEYNTQLFSSGSAQEMLTSIVVLTKQIIKAPRAQIASLDVLPEDSFQKVVHEWNKETEISLEAIDSPSVLEEIWKIGKAFPQRLAVVTPEKKLTYHDLIQKAEKLAFRLRESGLRPNEIVGLYTHREPDAIIGILGIQLAGGAYLPLDTTYPKDRLDFMLHDAGVKYIVDRTSTLPNELAENTKVVYIDEPVEVSPPVAFDFPKKDQLAYIIYTSGSTGKPKGVKITHHNLSISTKARDDFYSQKPDCFLLLSSLSFDSSVAGVFWTLTSGGTLLLSPERIEQDMAGLADLVHRFVVSHTLLLPSLYQLLLTYADPAQLSSLKTVIVAGEACRSSLANMHYGVLPSCLLVNEYGPTEGTVWSTAKRIPYSRTSKTISIGRPILGMKHYVLNANLSPVPVGVPGELFISGPALSSGYLGLDDLTAKKFLKNPFTSLAGYDRMYKTGDVVLYDKALKGDLKFIGRVDQQVKIRGHRVELDEVANQIDSFELIKESFVVYSSREEGTSSKLISFCSPQQAVEAENDIRDHLAKELPDYMQPDVFVFLDDFPRLPNGKINANKLEIPQVALEKKKETFSLPKGETEEQLARIWKNILNLENLGRNDNFFRLGGDSLKSIRLVGELKKAGFKIGTTDLFRYQSIKALAEVLDQRTNAQNPIVLSERNSIVPLKSEGEESPLFCLHSGGGHVFFYKPLADRITVNRPIYAVQPKALAGGNTEKADSIVEMARMYLEEIRKVAPSGPYNLLSTCFSNAVLLEIVRHLEKEQAEIGTLIVVDSAPAHKGKNKRKLVKNQPIRNMVRHLLNGDFEFLWQRIRKRIVIAGWMLSSINNETKRATYTTILDLNQLYASHKWLAVNQKIHFIRSTEFNERPDKKMQPDQWRKLATKGVEIHVVKGMHEKIFRMPAVEGLAKRINAIFQNTES